jgi:eukaryotic-like serine/threonine-protein kinase
VTTTLVKAGRYDLREELGRGAMGVVYHGFDPVIGRGVAVKTLRLSEAGTGLSRHELVGRFQTEARAAGLLTHPNIVVIFDAGEEDGLFYITMEYVEGRSLQTLIDAKQPFPLPRVLRLMEQVCSALDYAHQHNVVHRDIKPANLMLTSDDIVKITDFGTAKILQFGTAQTAHVMGTPSYMSPEQVKGKPVDGRSDIFSLGVVLYELMTGEKPFPGENITTVIYKIINEEPIPPRSLDSSIHPGLSTVITRALAKDPTARYQSCHELLNALKNFHEITGTESTLRIVASPSTAAPGSARSVAQQVPPRLGSSALNAKPNETGGAIHRSPMLAIEEKPAKRPGGLLLTVLLLGLIGYAGYRVYPPIMDLWSRAHASPDVQTPQATAESGAPAVNSESANAKPEAQSLDAPQTASQTAAQTSTQTPAQASAQAPAPAVAPVKSSAPPNAVPPAATPAVASEPFAAATKAVLPVAPSPARQLELKLRAELSGSPILDKVKLRPTANALTLSGALTLPEHREILLHLQTLPPGVRIIDDIDLAEGTKDAAATATTGFVMVESTPAAARILVDGAETGLRTPARVELKAGEHRIRLIRRGFGTAVKTVTINPGQTMQVAETLAGE